MSSSSCPVMTQQGKDDLESFTNALIKGGIDVKNIRDSLTTCPTTGGKRKNKKIIFNFYPASRTHYQVFFPIAYNEPGLLN